MNDETGVKDLVDIFEETNLSETREIEDEFDPDLFKEMAKRVKPPASQGGV